MSVPLDIGTTLLLVKEGDLNYVTDINELKKSPLSVKTVIYDS